MTLPASGAISFNAINVELGQPGATSANLNQASYRTLAGVASGQISLSNFYGKSSRPALAYTFSSPVANASLNVSSLSGYVAGVSDITITVGSGVYLYATSTGSYGLNLSGGSSGDTLQLVNNGFIMGKGGVGAGPSGPFTNGGSGGPALNIGYPTTINNTNGSAYIGGGGGGGSTSEGAGGGGGAGGGDGGTSNRSTGTYPGGAGGSIGASGSPAGTGGSGGGAGGGGGGYFTRPAGKATENVRVGGGGGGRIFPGTGGGGYNYGGGTGGSANNNGSLGFEAGGGGGWGANGGIGRPQGGSGGPSVGSGGGKAVNLNGYSVTWVSGDTARIYGSVS